MTIKNQLKDVREASRKLVLLDDQKIVSLLMDLADLAESKTEFILSENVKDLERMDKDDPKYDRLKLTEARIKDIASDIRNVAGLDNPVGKTISESIRPNGLKISKVTVPFGVIGIIYEARPNVTFDVFSLCLKSGNAVVLKGGSDAIYSNTAIVSIIQDVLEKHGIDKNIVCLLPAGREETTEMLNAHGFIDLIIPRGSQGLINFVRENSSIPVIETGAGICHTYLDASGDKDKANEIIYNAKTRRPSVCNALDCLVIHKDQLSNLVEFGENLVKDEVEIFADEESFAILDGNYPSNLLHKATNESFGTEFLSMKMSIKTVDSFDAAIDHINTYTSQHSEAIIAEDKEVVAKYIKVMDAASVFANVSTAFTDGAQFGLGAEIGISTQKLHARGPMALEELTSYKWVINGDGHVRPK